MPRSASSVCSSPMSSGGGSSHAGSVCSTPRQPKRLRVDDAAGGSSAPKLKKLKDSAASAALIAARHELEHKAQNVQIAAIVERLRAEPALANSIMGMIEQAEAAQSSRCFLDRNKKDIASLPDWFRKMMLHAVFLGDFTEDKNSPFHKVKQTDLNNLTEWLLESESSMKLPKKNAAVAPMLLCIALYMISRNHWFMFSEYLKKWQELKSETSGKPALALMTREIWTHTIGDWFLSMQKDGNFTGVCHRRTQTHLPLPFGIAIPVASTHGQRPDCFIDSNSSTFSAKLRIASSSLTLPLAPLATSGASRIVLTPEGSSTPELCTAQEWILLEQLCEDVSFSPARFLREAAKARRNGKTGAQIWAMVGDTCSPTLTLHIEARGEPAAAGQQPPAPIENVQPVVQAEVQAPNNAEESEAPPPAPIEDGQPAPATPRAPDEDEDEEDPNIQILGESL